MFSYFLNVYVKMIACPKDTIYHANVSCITCESQVSPKISSSVEMLCGNMHGRTLHSPYFCKHNIVTGHSQFDLYVSHLQLSSPSRTLNHDKVVTSFDFVPPLAAMQHVFEHAYPLMIQSLCYVFPKLSWVFVGAVGE